MPRAFRAFLSLSPRDKLETLRAAGLMTGIEVMLRSVAVTTVARRLGVPLNLGPSGAVPGTADLTERLSPDERRRIVAVERVLRRWPFGDSCLRRSLAIGHVLRRRHPRLRVGVALDSADVRAHAWLEVDGARIGESMELPYRTLHKVPLSR